jgi:hypothetical protein
MIEKTTTRHRLLDDASHPEPQLLKWKSSRLPICIVVLSIPAPTGAGPNVNRKIESERLHASVSVQ